MPTAQHTNRPSSKKIQTDNVKCRSMQLDEKDAIRNQHTEISIAITSVFSVSNVSLPFHFYLQILQNQMTQQDQKLTGNINLVT